MIRDEPTRDHRLHEVLGRYYEAAETGTEPDRAAWIADHPDLADDLAAFFHDQDRLATFVRPPEIPIKDFGDYEILREIARGGMGVVYEAHQKSLNRTVALKMILDGAYASPDALRRFRIEAESAASLDHPNIVPIHEVNDHAGRPYISMKYLSGGSLANHLGDYHAVPRAAASLLAIIARAVHHAHQCGVLHRDLKPGNILLDANGQPHVADFGLARRINIDDGVTHTGAFLGSPAYMAPEQAGATRSVSTAADVYGLGAILYALLTGRAPFRGDSALETMENVRDKTPETPSKVNPKVDRDLATICLKCLEKDPTRRYSSAEALADDLGRWLDGEPISARPIGRVERLRRWCHKSPFQAIASGLAAFLIVGTIAGLSLVVRSQDAALVQRRRAENNGFWFAQGSIEPLKRLANPRFAEDPDLLECRHEILDLAAQAHERLADTLDHNEFGRIALFIHIALLRTIDGDPLHAWQTYRKAISIAEACTIVSPRDPVAWEGLAQVQGHLGMDLWLHGRVSESTTYLRAASENFRLALELGAVHSTEFQHAAWFFLFCPDERLRDPALGASLARRVVAMAPDHEARNPTFLGGVRPRFTMALASYRMGDLTTARESLERSMAMRSGGDAYEWFLLALIQAKEGNINKARKTCDRATLWTRKNRYGDFELHFLHTEAEAAIGGITSLPAPTADLTGTER